MVFLLFFNSVVRSERSERIRIFCLFFCFGRGSFYIYTYLFKITRCFTPPFFFFFFLGVGGGGVRLREQVSAILRTHLGCDFRDQGVGCRRGLMEAYFPF